jgi:hypothetical protein
VFRSGGFLRTPPRGTTRYKGTGMNDEMSGEPHTVSKERRRALLAVHHGRYGYRGVRFDARRGLFRAAIGSKAKDLGRFKTAVEAAIAYGAAAVEMYGSDACLNFPGPGQRKTQFGTRCTHGASNLSRHGLCRERNRAAVHRYKIRKRQHHGDTTATK